MLTRLLALILAFCSLSQGALDIIAVEADLGGYLFLVNRDYPVSADYVPSDLVKLTVKSSGEQQMRKEAAAALENMFLAAKEEMGYTLVAVSGYRSYGQQARIYNRKVQSTGSVKKAQLLVAPPGTSEHQLGLAMDLGSMRNQALSASFGNTDEGKWVAANAHRFGFIIRYKAAWTDVTGYADEPWHVRYVGASHAQTLFETDVPLETYIEALRLAKLENAQGGL